MVSIVNDSEVRLRRTFSATFRHLPSSPLPEASPSGQLTPLLTAFEVMSLMSWHCYMAEYSLRITPATDGYDAAAAASGAKLTETHTRSLPPPVPKLPTGWFQPRCRPLNYAVVVGAAEALVVLSSASVVTGHFSHTRKAVISGSWLRWSWRVGYISIWVDSHACNKF